MQNYLNCRSTGARALLTLVLFVAGGGLVVKAASFRPEADTVSQRTLTFADRVAYQRAVEEVYWQHRIWPKENPGPKPSLDKVMSEQQVQQKVQEYLRNSQLLADQWQRPITAEQLQAEINRMASHTRQPEVLRELFVALGNDPFIIAECLARPVLSERLVAELRVASNAADAPEPLGMTETESSMMTDQLGADYYLPEIASSPVEYPAGGCVDNWTATSTVGAPDNRAYPTAVWTGSEMIVWGGGANNVGYQNTGGRYNPSTDSWVATTTNGAPTKRFSHTAVWTGTEMIVWGGGTNTTSLNTGGRYNPSTDSWTATTTTDAPQGRRAHTAVWTGSEMIVWGGSVDLNTGGRYNPSTDSWVATATTGAPDGRSGPSAVWTGGEMIVWGGQNDHSVSSNTGGRYNPNTDSWVATTTNNAPDARFGHTAVWTGGEMIVWGGYDNQHPPLKNTGGRYNPSTDSWVATTTNNAPDGRYEHTAVWTGTEMIVWGGQGTQCCDHLNSGGRYNPSTDGWVATTTTGAPAGRWFHAAVWTGSEMIVWGGYNNGDPRNAGGRYAPCTESWAPTTTTGAPDTRYHHTAVWTGAEMIVWGGSNDNGSLKTGGRYNPSTDSWIATTTVGAPTARTNHTAVWTGTEMIVWGGLGNTGKLKTGGRYNPSTDSWVATTTNGAPTKRWFQSAVWTGTEMIVWGGEDAATNREVKTGGRYNPSTDSWLPTATRQAPDGRVYHSAVWTGTEMIVWGGYDRDTNSINTGGRYNPSTDSWVATTITGAPDQRYWHTAVWTGTEMIVWGGASEIAIFNDGGKYNPGTNSWVATTIGGAPDRRAYHTAVWTGTEMIVWGGTYDFSGTCFNTGGRYNPSTDNWIATTTTGAPDGRHLHTAVWIGTEMIVWGGQCTGTGNLNTGGRYSP